MLFNTSKKIPENAQDQLEEANGILKTLSPIVQNLYQNKAMHWIGAGFDRLISFIFIFLGMACMGFVFIMDTVFPFHVLGEIMNSQQVNNIISNNSDLNTFQIAIKGLVIIIGLLFWSLAYIQNELRKRKKLLHEAGNELKNIERIFIEKQKAIEPSASKNNETFTKIEPKPFEME